MGKKKLKTFNKSHLICEVSKKHKTSKVEASLVVETVLNSIIRTIKRGGRVEIRGFGSFELRKYRAYQGRNPRTGESIHVKAKKAPFFKVGRLREQINKKK